MRGKTIVFRSVRCYMFTLEVRKVTRKAYQAKARETLLTPKEAAEFVGVTGQTLKNWRLKGVGPAYVKVGRNIFYSQKRLEEYLDSLIEVVVPKPKKSVA